MRLYKGKNKDFDLLKSLALKYGIIVNKQMTINQLKQLIKRKVN